MGLIKQKKQQPADGAAAGRQPVCAHLAHLSTEQAAALLTAETKVFRRVLLLCVALMMVNYLDRTNLSFAAVQLNKDIGLDHATYGLGAGLFFAAYASMQVPANLVMTKVGGPIMLATIGTAWGIVAACFALVKNVPSFLALRVLLGLFEAGALPGMWALLSHFYSKQRITMPLGWLMGGLIVSQALGAPLAAGLMALDGKGGLRGWQWLFLIEGVVAVLVSVQFFFMPRDVDAMRSLTPEERAALHASMAHGAKPTTDAKAALLSALRNPAVWWAGVGVKFFRDVAFYGLMYWLPLIIESLLPASQPNKSTLAVLLTAVPFICSAAAQFLTCWHSQRTNERRLHLAACWALGVACLALMPVTELRGVHAASFVLLVLGVVGVFGVEGISISYYLALMGGEKGIGIAVINMLGACGGFAGPYIIGAFTQASGNYIAALWLMAGALALAVVNVLLLTEAWAAKFSLKQHHHHHHHQQQPGALGDAPHEHQHHIASYAVGDAGVVMTGLGSLMDSSSSCSSLASAAGAAQQGDVEMGGMPPAAPAAGAAAAGAAAKSG